MPFFSALEFHQQSQAGQALPSDFHHRPFATESRRAFRAAAESPAAIAPRTPCAPGSPEAPSTLSLLRCPTGSRDCGEGEEHPIDSSSPAPSHSGAADMKSSAKEVSKSKFRLPRPARPGEPNYSAVCSGHGSLFGYSPKTPFAGKELMLAEMRHSSTLSSGVFHSLAPSCGRYFL